MSTSRRRARIRRATIAGGQGFETTVRSPAVGPRKALVDPSTTSWDKQPESFESKDTALRDKQRRSLAATLSPHDQRED